VNATDPTSATKTVALLPPEWPGTVVMGDEEIAAARAVLAARSPFRYYGPEPLGYTRRFEEACANRLGRRNALAVNSGTAALSIAMAAYGIGPGDEVLVPGYLWPSCIAAVVRAGAIPKLVDIDETFNVAPAALDATVTTNSRAVLVIHMNGCPPRLDEVLQVARRHGLLVIEDVAQANGGSFFGKPLGSFGDAATFSFQLNKTITAGEGGLIASDDELFALRASAAHDIGFPRNASGRLVTDDPRGRMWGFGSRMSELGAAVLYAQEQKIRDIVSRMRAAARRLYDGIGGLSTVQTRHRPDPEGDLGSFVLLTWPDAQYAREIVRRTRERGVRSSHGGLNNLVMTDWGLHLYSNNLNLVDRLSTGAAGYPWKDPANAFAAPYRYGHGSLPTADDLFSRSSLIAVSPALSDDAVDAVIEAFHASAAAMA
jgi:dTDP-4-amino-4,6-dideoxygalactose transaminase